MEKEKIITVVKNCFTSNGVIQNYYDLYFTNYKLVLVFVGESHRSFLLKNPNPGSNYRKELQEQSLKQIIISSDRNIVFSKNEIEELNIKEGNFIKNSSLTINTKENDLKLFNKEKEIDWKNLKKKLYNFAYPLS